MEDRRFAVDDCGDDGGDDGGIFGTSTMADVSKEPDEATQEDYSGSAVSALRRIAFLLERSRAESYKVKAFRAAADTILPLGDDVAARVRAGTLRELAGIGVPGDDAAGRDHGGCRGDVRLRVQADRARRVHTFRAA